MKCLFICLALMCCLRAGAKRRPIKNVVIVTTDGLRWQEVFRGMDTALASDAAFNQRDSAHLYKHYWSADIAHRRAMIFPFLWNTVATEGQLWGNRDKGSHVNVSNPYWFSYPGYNELLCGFADTLINSNAYPPNPHTNLLEFLNKQKQFTGRVGAFGAWDAFDRILNEKRSGFEVVCGQDTCADVDDDGRLLNDMKRHAYSPFGEEEPLDMFTHYMAMNQLKKRRLKVTYTI